jgi:SAM-dependent methyltransferase
MNTVEDENTISFSFGENWQNYLGSVSDQEIDEAKKDIEKWLGLDSVSGKTVIDIGCGSGIHSLAFYLLGAKKICSFDYDKLSVAAAKTLWEKEGKPSNWRIYQGSILDQESIESLGKFDIVYSWGVLHHTGAMWDALDKSIGLIMEGGVLWVSLYVAGPRYIQDLKLKKKYNASSEWGKRWMIGKWVGVLMLSRLRHLQNPFTWNQSRGRGMNVYHDIIDWLGGLPYEVASEDAVLRFARENDLVLERIKVKNEGACSIYVFSLPTKTGKN